MGWNFRKSTRLGPFRVNVSKSGVGYSMGGRGFRVGTNAQGRRYTTFSIPGTGLSYRKSLPKSGCATLLVAVAVVLLGTLILKAAK
jgi:predicted alpha/beta hydrolase